MERYLKQLRHQRSPEEEKEIARRARKRKATRKGRGPRRKRGWDDDDDLQGFERMRASTQDLAPATPTETEAGAIVAHALVVGLGAGRAHVRMERRDGAEQDGSLAEETIDATLSPFLAVRQKSGVAVGDRVGLEERGAGTWRVAEVLPRRSRLSRPDPSRPDLERVLAANVDLGIVVVAVREPRFRPRLIDRLTIALRHGGVDAIVCANKVDLLTSQERDEIDRELEVQRAAGVACLWTSPESGEGIEALREHMRGKTCVLLGQSGVGKSSLANALDPGLDLRTGRVRGSDGKGRHTTTSSRLFELSMDGAPSGTRLIDTPGVRSFGLHEIGASDLVLYFDDLMAFAPGCRFRDCSHVEDPDCAVRAAAEDGRASAARYATFLRLRATLV